ncbi:MAG: protein kinase domain-containing protein [Gemmatimonadales bacterium]
MDTFFERLRRALAPEFTLARELGSGGQGTVVLAHDVALDRPVAIKVLRPDRASAHAAERFQREARLLANLSHPNIVPVHTTDVADGIYYYVMDWLQGETLADRLARSMLTRQEAVKVCRDLLDALEAAHRRGIVHRDIKPKNIFLVDGRGVLTDFGIAKRLTEAGSAITVPGQPVGTFEYMPPEQTVGGEVTPRTDLYAVGMVAYEALTGRRWSILDNPDAGDWRGVPPALVPALRRALAWAPADRWPDAATFKRALWRPREADWRRTAITALVVAGGGLGLWKTVQVLLRRPADLRIASLEVSGPGAVELKRIGDSVAQLVVNRLTGFPDFSVVGPRRDKRAKLMVRGSVAVSGSSLRVSLWLPSRPPFGIPTTVHDVETAADQLADSLLVRLFSASALDSVLPVRVMPRSPGGLKAFLTAEKLFAQAQWPEALVGYQDAITVDPTCWLCYQRQADVRRWLGQVEDTTSLRLAMDHIAQFPPHYQSLLRVDGLDLRARFDTLDALVQRARDFLFGPFRLGDEQLHRGPLLGRERRLAATALQQALRIRPDFAPAQEHLIWLWVAEGDSVEAFRGIAKLRGMPGARSGLSLLVQAAAAWRFLGSSEAASRTDALVGGGSGVDASQLSVGARYLNGFDAPRGAIWLGRKIEEQPDHGYSPLVAEVIGYMALGRTDSARAVLRRLQARFPSQSLELFGQELDAVALMFADDSPAARASGVPLARRLRAMATATHITTALRRRAAWMAGLLERRFTGGRGAVPVTRDTMPAQLRSLLDVYDRALGGDWDLALRSSEPLRLVRAEHVADPFYRTVLHLLRAQWFITNGQWESADRELLWYQNTDQATLPHFEPQAMEVDWAFGTLARWRRVQLADRRRMPGEVRCSLYRDVVRNWSEGEAPYAARADSARALALTLKCPS